MSTNVLNTNYEANYNYTAPTAMSVVPQQPFRPNHLPINPQQTMNPNLFTPNDYNQLNLSTPDLINVLSAETPIDGQPLSGSCFFCSIYLDIDLIIIYS